MSLIHFGRRRNRPPTESAMRKLRYNSDLQLNISIEYPDVIEP
jgi:hypothetical protein